MKRRHQDDTGLLDEASETSPTARFLINCFYAELMYLPYFAVSSFRQRVSVERHLNQILSLDRARREGLIRNWSLKWRRTGHGTYPLEPYRVYVQLPAGTETKSVLPRPVLAEMRRLRGHLRR